MIITEREKKNDRVIKKVDHRINKLLRNCYLIHIDGLKIFFVCFKDHFLNYNYNINDR